MSAPPDWLGVVATGQSLSTGDEPVLTKAQPFGNLMLSLGTTVVPPWDAESQALAMVPLVEPMRAPGSGFPRAYPDNLWGETGYAVMANQITALARGAGPQGEIVIVPTAVGESGQGIEALVKRASTDCQMGRAYAASLFEVAAIARLARAQGRRYRVAMVMMTHGETDNNNVGYGDALLSLLEDYNADLRAITGQTERIPMFLSQQFAFPSGAGERPQVNQFQWQLAASHPADFVCTGPKYHLMGVGDGVHLSAVGYQQHGEKTAQVFHERIVRGRDWKALHPSAVARAGRTITVRFHVPVPSLRWNEALDPAPAAAWANGRGFEVRAGSAPLDIARVELADADAVRITCAADLPATGLVVGYAMTSGGRQLSTHSRSYRWGQLHDADPFVGQATRLAQPNYCVSFEMPVP